MPILVVQMGHCYRKSGATGTAGEQDYATKVATACRNLLHGRGGWTVRTILADDALSLYRGDAFVAIHCDGSTSATAHGASIGYRTAEGQAFGQAWKRAYDTRGWDNGFRPDNYTPALQGYYGVGNAVNQGNRRAFIAECGFLTSSADRDVLNGPGGPERVALSIGDALGIPVAPPEVPDMELTDEVVWWNGKKVTVKDIFAATYIAASGLLGNAAFPGETVVQLPPLVGIRSTVDSLTDDESKVLAAVNGSRGEVLAGLAGVLAALDTVDGTPSDEQVALLGAQLSAVLPPAIATQLGQRLITPVEG